MRVLGIDPGLRHTGWGLVDRRSEDSALVFVSCGVISPCTDACLAERLGEIYRGLVAVAQEVRPSLVAVEDAYINRNPRTSWHLAHARAAALVAVHSTGLTVNEPAPRLVKKSLTGNGNASKPQVEAMVRRLLPRVPRDLDPNTADALAVAIHGAHWHSVNPQLVPTRGLP